MVTLDSADPDDSEILALLAEGRTYSSSYADLSDAELIIRALGMLVLVPRSISARSSKPSARRRRWPSPVPSDENW